MSKKTKKTEVIDPHAKRESQKYQNPIPSREYILEYLEKAGRPLTRDALESGLNLFDDDSREALRRRLRAMERDAQLIFNRRREYALVSKMNLVKGRVIGHADGFGFLVTEDEGDDIFLAAREMRSLLHGDRALVSITGVDRRGRREGALVEVMERANETIVGRLFIEKGVSFVVPDNKRINQDVLIAAENLNNATHGQIVIAHLVEQPNRYRQPLGRVVEIVGEHMAPGMEIDVAIRAHDLPLNWSDETLAEIAGLSPEVNEADKQGRTDIRDLPLVTIDGEDARDFDDAVYCEPREGKGWRLLVAIADVSHYVIPDTALDRDARERGTSVYFPERVIPMLPEILSNGLCSLKPKVDRLCMVCDMQLSSTGKLENWRFYPALMHSHARLTYTQVAAMLVDGDQALSNEYQAVLPHLEHLHALYKIMRQRRNERGAIDFETTETRIVFGESRKIEQIIPVIRNDAHKLIEECMIIANVATARHLLKNKIPALYRVHEGPTAEKLEPLRAFLSELGLSLSGADDPKPADYARLLGEIDQRADAHLVQTVLLRSLRQAVYSPDNIGHFGLSFDAYAHFTSPIRRYPDLVVHRALKHLCENKSLDSFIYTHADVEATGEHCSQTERKADEATRDAVDWLKCEYMLDKVGEEFDGIINTVTNFGLFVELNDIYVEGLIHVTGLDNDYYQYDPVKHRMLGERTNQSFRLGDPISVKVARVDLDTKKIDFQWSGSSKDISDKGNDKYSGKGKRKDRGKHRRKGKGKGKFDKNNPWPQKKPGSSHVKASYQELNKQSDATESGEPRTQLTAKTKSVKDQPVKNKSVLKKKISKKTSGKKQRVVKENATKEVVKKKVDTKKVGKKKVVNKKVAKKKVANKKVAKKKVVNKKVAKKKLANKKVAKKKVVNKKVAKKKVAKKKLANKKVAKKKPVRKKVSKKKTR